MAALKSSVVAPPFASCSAVRNPAIKLAPQRAIYRGPKHSFGMIVSSFPFWFAINLSRTRREAGPGNDESMPSICLESRTDAVVGASNNALPSNRPPAGFTTRPAISSMAVEHSYTSNESSASNTQQPTKPEMRPAAEVFGFLLEKRQRSTSMPMSVVPTSNFLPATRNINLPANHTRTTSATAKISKPPVSLSNALQPAGISASAVTPSSNGSNLVDPSHTATATRASRIPRGRLSLQLNPETQLLTTSSKGPAPTLISNNYDMLRSATNTVERAHVATSHLTSASERDVTPAPKRSAHRRSASSGMSRQIPNSWRAVPATTGAAHSKGLRADDGKENASNPVSTAKNVGLRTSSPSFGAVVWLTRTYTDSSLKPKSRLPVTPSHERVLLSSAPSPDSSTELSPLGRKMMADLRKQRRARSERRNDQVARAVVHI
jgi:hypothetical protein